MFSFSTEKVTTASRRLAADLVRCRRCEWYSCVRMSIAVPFWPLARTATIGVAGGELGAATGSLSDDNSSVVSRLGHSNDGH